MSCWVTRSEARKKRVVREGWNLRRKTWQLSLNLDCTLELPGELNIAGILAPFLGILS